jgi:hypothetical protein
VRIFYRKYPKRLLKRAWRERGYGRERYYRWDEKNRSETVEERHESDERGLELWKQHIRAGWKETNRAGSQVETAAEF